jgi:hypothetical protein
MKFYGIFTVNVLRLRIMIPNKCTSVCLLYKVVQIWPGQTVTCLHTNSPGHIWTTLYIQTLLHVSAPLGHLQGVIHSRIWSSSKTTCRQYKTVCGQSRLVKVKMLWYWPDIVLLLDHILQCITPWRWPKGAETCRSVCICNKHTEVHLLDVIILNFKWHVCIPRKFSICLCSG